MSGYLFAYVVASSVALVFLLRDMLEARKYRVDMRERLEQVQPLPPLYTLGDGVPVIVADDGGSPLLEDISADRYDQVASVSSDGAVLGSSFEAAW